MNIQEEKSIICVKENRLKRFVNLIKKLFNKKKQSDNIEKTINTANKEKKSKSEILEIYNKAKIGEYNLNQLDIEDLQILNKLIEEEIKIKTKKLDQIITDTNMKKYNLKNM